MGRSKYGWLEKVSLLLFIICFVLILLQVISRYVFGKPIVWTEEMARYSLVWITFISAALVMSYDGHVNIDLLIVKMPSIKKFASYFESVLVILFFTITIIYSIKLAIETHTIRSVSLDFIRWSYVYLSVPVGFSIMLVQYIKKLIMKLKNIKTNNTKS